MHKTEKVGGRRTSSMELVFIILARVFVLFVPLVISSLLIRFSVVMKFIWLKGPEGDPWREPATDHGGTLNIFRIASRAGLSPETLTLDETGAFEGITIDIIREFSTEAAGSSKEFAVNVDGKPAHSASTCLHLPYLFVYSLFPIRGFCFGCWNVFTVMFYICSLFTNTNSFLLVMDAMDGFLVMCIRIASRSHGFMHLGFE